MARMLNQTEDVDVWVLIAQFDFALCSEDRQILQNLNTEKRGAEKKLNLDVALKAIEDSI